MGGVVEKMERDIYLEFENMEEGSYYLFAEVDFCPNPDLIKSFVVGCYGVAKIEIENI